MKEPAYLLFLPQATVPLMQNTEAGDYLSSNKYFSYKKKCVPDMETMRKKNV